MIRLYIQGLTLCCAMFLGSGALRAQDTTGGPLSVLVDAASRRLPLLLQKQALVNSAKAGVSFARNSFLPTAEALDQVNMASANSLPGAYESFGIIPSVSSSVRGAQNWQAVSGDIAVLYSQYELVNFGLRKAKVGNAQSLVGVRQADLDFQTYLLKDQVSKIYFELLKNKYQLAVDQQNIQRYAAVDTIIHALTASGIRAGVDSSLAQAERSKARVIYNQRLGTIAQLTQQLSYLTGLAPQQVVVDTATRQNMVPDPGTETLRNPLLEYYQQQKQYYLSSETLVKKSYLPKIIVSGGAWGRGSSIAPDDETYKNLSSGLGYQRFNYMIGLTFAYNLFDPIHRKDALTEARFQTQATDYALQQQELDLRSAAAQAQEAITEAENNLREIPIQIKAATDAYNQKIAQYKAGIINLVDLTEATYVLYSAQISYAETLNSWFLAHLDKATATGSLNQFIQSIK